ncbi:MAG: hypothetical protein LBF97_01875 [Elusimicrobiota bacterium]|jgi:hypothetical protein|nr:hypothetical protein [Elusimicrobiota bacterium]
MIASFFAYTFITNGYIHYLDSDGHNQIGHIIDSFSVYEDLFYFDEFVSSADQTAGNYFIEDMKKIYKNQDGVYKYFLKLIYALNHYNQNKSLSIGGLEFNNINKIILNFYFDNLEIHYQVTEKSQGGLYNYIQITTQND